MSSAKKSDDKAWKTPNEVNFCLQFIFFVCLIIFFFCACGMLKEFVIVLFIDMQIIRLQRLKQKQKALQARLERPAYNTRNSPSKFRITPSEKRKNPFLLE